MQKGLMDLHQQPCAGNLAIDGLGLEPRAAGHDARPAVDAQGFIHARNHENQPDLRIFEDVSHAIQAVVAGPVRNE